MHSFANNPSLQVDARRAWRRAWGSSFAIHGVAIGLAIGWMLLADTDLPSESKARLEVDGGWGATPTLEATMHVPRPQSAGAGSETATAGVDEGWEPAMARAASGESLPSDTKDGVSSFVRRRIDQSIEQGKSQSQEENLEQLSKLGRRLSSSSNPENVDAIASFLSGVVGDRATEPNPEMQQQPFDVDTAQIHQVRRERDDAAGEYRYLAIMIDRKGTTMELELDRESGKQLDKTMKLIESNPLLERVYRKILMGILDQALRNSSPSTSA